jgi:uncharacterized repeat protein (TIGR01451 family)
VDELPAGVSFVSASASQGAGCDFLGGRVTCRLGALAAGAGAEVTIRGRPTQTGIVTNRATVQANEPDADAFDNAAETRTRVDPAADLALVLRDSPDPVRVRDRLTYELAVTNVGPSTAGTVRLADSLPGGVRLISASVSGGNCSASGDTVICTVFGLSSGEAVTATIVVSPKRAGTITNSASVTSDVADPVAGNNAATATTSVVK